MDKKKNLKELADFIDIDLTDLKGERGDIGDPGKDADEEKIIYEVLKKIPSAKDGRDGHSPLTVSKIKPKNPQKGDLWYQD